MSAWTEIRPNLFEHTNGNWVWRVGKAYEVWYLINGQHKYGGITSDRKTASEWAEKGSQCIK